MIDVWLGIDLGTSNSLCSICILNDKNSIIDILQVKSDQEVLKYGIDGMYITPSFVQYNIYDKVSCAGETARTGRILGQDKQRLIYNFKRIIGRTYEEALEEKQNLNLPYSLSKDENGMAKIVVGSKELFPEEIAAELLNKIIDNAREFIKQKYKDEMNVLKLVLTVPAYFGKPQKNATKKAAILAVQKANLPLKDSIENIEMIQEPIAAAAACAYDGKFAETDKNILIVDLGAGTFDIALVDHKEIQKKNAIKNQIDAKSIGGGTRLGGVDMDRTILNWLLDQLDGPLKEKGMSRDDLLNDNIDYNDIVEDNKIKLSTQEKVDIGIAKLLTNVTLTREKLEELLSPFIEECRSKIRESLQNAEKIKKEDISKVVLIGGPTRMPIIQRMIREEIGDIVLDGVNPMTAVSQGAVKSFITKTVDQKEIKGKPSENTTPVISRNYGLEVNGSFKIIAEKKMKLPCVQSEMVTFLIDKDAIVIHPVQEDPEKKATNQNNIICETLGIYRYPLPKVSNIFTVDAKIEFQISKDEELNVIVNYLDDSMELRLRNKYEFVELKVDTNGSGFDFVNIVLSAFFTNDFKISHKLQRAVEKVGEVNNTPELRFDDKATYLQIKSLADDLQDVVMTIYNYIIQTICKAIGYSTTEIHEFIKKSNNNIGILENEYKLLQEQLSTLQTINTINRISDDLVNASEFISIDYKINQINEILPGGIKETEWIKAIEDAEETLRRGRVKIRNDDVKSHDVQFYQSKINELEKQIQYVRGKWAKVIDKTLPIKELQLIKKLTIEISTI